jgi:hypothetical protein
MMDRSALGFCFFFWSLDESLDRVAIVRGAGASGGTAWLWEESDVKLGVATSSSKELIDGLFCWIPVGAFTPIPRGRRKVHVSTWVCYRRAPPVAVAWGIQRPVLLVPLQNSA